MPRDPCMHVRLSDFVDILSCNGIDNPQSFAERIFQQALPVGIKDRWNLEADQKTKDKLAKVIAASKRSAVTVQQFNRILDRERRAIGHLHMKPIVKGTPNYLILMEVANLAADFCQQCGFESMDEGCKTYVQLGLAKMRRHSSYAIGKFKYYDTAIYQAYESHDMLANDPGPQRTKAFHDMYMLLVAEYAGISPDLTKKEDYVSFLYARLEADSIQADCEDWLRAQFELLGKWYNAVPNVNQLFGEGAVKRYWQYFRVPQVQQDDLIVRWDTSSSFESRYQEKLREKYADKSLK